MHRESQVVRVETDKGKAFGIIQAVLAFHCFVKYWDEKGRWNWDYFEHDEIEIVGQIGYEVE